MRLPQRRVAAVARCCNSALRPLPTSFGGHVALSCVPYRVSLPEQRMQTLGAVLHQVGVFPTTAWLCAPALVSAWQPATPAAVVLTAVAGQAVPAPHGLVRCLFLDEVQLLMDRLLRQVPGATPELRVETLRRYKQEADFPALTADPELLARHLVEAVRYGTLPPPEALTHFRRCFSHFTREAAQHILAKAFLKW